MQIVMNDAARRRLEEADAVYVWPREQRCCGGRRYVLEASLSHPGGAFDQRGDASGVRVLTRTGLVEPEVLQLEVDRKGRLHAFWNGQAWVG
jgi:hypothetical protein